MISLLGYRAVAWICRQRLEPPDGWTMALTDTDLLHTETPFCVVVAGYGR